MTGEKGTLRYTRYETSRNKEFGVSYWEGEDNGGAHSRKIKGCT